MAESSRLEELNEVTRNRVSDREVGLTPRAGPCVSLLLVGLGSRVSDENFSFGILVEEVEEGMASSESCLKVVNGILTGAAEPVDDAKGTSANVFFKVLPCGFLVRASGGRSAVVRESV